MRRRTFFRGLLSAIAMACFHFNGKPQLDFETSQCVPISLFPGDCPVESSAEIRLHYYTSTGFVGSKATAYPK